MEVEVYTNDEVKRYLSRKFILIKLNAESERKHKLGDGEYTEAEIAQLFGVRGYPTTVFIREDTHPITLVPGYFPPDMFMKILMFIGDDYYTKMNFEEYLEKMGVNPKE
jgi:thioredoxin-related protein